MPGTITIVNLPATGTDAATGINATNTYLCCLAFGSAAGGVTINSVPFQQVHPGGVAPPFNGTDTTHGGTYSLSANHNLNSTSNGNAASQADGSTETMLGTVIFVQSSAPVNSDLDQTYGGLTAGAQYALRLYYRQWVSPDNRSINVGFNGEGTEQDYSGNPFNESAGGANYIEYDFRAASTTVNVFMTNLVANESVMISGMSLQETAPPVVNVAPSIATNGQPVGFTNWVGLDSALAVSASGSPAPAYQWYQNNTLLSGATNPGLGFSPLAITNAGSYYVTVTNVAGAVTSSVAVVQVLVNPVTNVISSTLSQVALPPTNTDANTGIGAGANTNYLCVLDFGLTAFSGAVNGITFTPVSIASGTTASGSDPNYGGTWTASTTDVNGFKSISGDSGAGPNPVAGQADGNMASVLNGANYLGVAPIATTATFDFSGLTFGAGYALRFYYQQWTADSPFRTVQFTFNGDGTNAVFQTDEDIGGGGSYYIEYDFKAARSDVSLLLTDESSQANFGPMIYAIVLQQTAAAPPAPVAPFITVQPVGITNWSGLNGSLSVSASASPNPAYQWYQNNLPVPGATTAVLSLSPLATNNAGSYYVAVTNSAGTTNSSVVIVDVLSGTVVITPTLSQLQISTTGADAASGVGLTASGSNYLCALDFGASASAVAVNGINFTPVNLTGTNQSGTDPNYGGTWAASTTDTNGFKDVNGGGSAVGLQADPNTEYILNGATYLGVAPVGTSATFQFGTLDAGANYSLCYFYRQYDAGDSPIRPVQFTFNGNGNNTVYTVDELTRGSVLP